MLPSDSINLETTSPVEAKVLATISAKVFTYIRLALNDGPLL